MCWLQHLRALGSFRHRFPRRSRLHWRPPSHNQTQDRRSPRCRRSSCRRWYPWRPLAPFFKQGSGIFWDGLDVDPWETLGINIAGVLTIILWAGFWSCALFGSLKAAGMLRIDSETEFKGCDIVS